MMDIWPRAGHPQGVNPQPEKSDDLAEQLKRAEEALRERELNFQRMEAQLAGEKRLLEMVASGYALTDVLNELCKFVENTADCRCAIYLADSREANSGWSTPIHARDGQVLGTFAILQHEPASPTRVQLDLIAQVTHIASIAIERALNEEALNKARSELAHVARVMSLGALTASIAHEVNQPLSGIITNASTCMRMLGADPPNIDGARETMKRTIRDGRRASDVIARLRALFSKKDETAELVDLNQATREVITLSLSELHRNRVILKPELASDLPHVTGDRVQLQQVILNLLRNASDAMTTIVDRPRQLIIKTEPEADGRVRLSVQDTGVGFDVESVNKLFEAFYTTKSDGMGIGLSVSRSIIENHNGTLTARPNDGPGATFSFSIPCAAHTDHTHAARQS